MMMVGCNSTALSTKAIPSNLKQPCDNLNTLDGNTGKELMLWATETVSKYNDCYYKHEALIKALK